MNLKKMLFLCGSLLSHFAAVPAYADFQLNLSLGAIQQVQPGELFLSVSVGFTGDPGDYLNQFTLSLNNNALPVDFDYTRFSLRNLQNNFQGSGPLSNVGVADVTLSSPATLAASSTLLLGELVVNTNGLQLGIYEITFHATQTDASGTIGGASNEFLQDVGGLVVSNSRSFNIAAVPEPTTWLGAMGLLGCLWCARRSR